jgi:flagellar hook-length control protein FliK
MSEISRSAPPAPKPAAPPNRSQTGNTGEQGGDAFAALLSMVADTRAAPVAPADADASPGEPSVADDEASDTPDDDNNPVVQLLGWPDPGSVGRASAPAPAATTPATTPAATLATATATATGISDTTGKEKPAGLDISGMTALAKPEAIDPASLPPGAIAARAVTGQVDGRDARTTGVRRDAKTPVGNDPAAALRASAPSMQAQLVTAGRSTAPSGVAETARGRGAAWAASTVSMDLSAVREADSVAGNAVSLTARLSELLTGKAQADGAAPTPLLGALQDTSSAKSEGPSPADLLPMPDAATDAEPSPLSHWSTQNLRHAHLRLGDGGLDSLDIRLSMQGQDLSVDFRSDNADIRHSLAQQANQSLASLLERSGIALADVSVGAQHRQPGGQGAGGDPGQGQGTAQNGRSAMGRADASDPALAAKSLALPAMRADGSRPLDLFV